MTALRQRRIRLAHQRNRMACTKLSQSLALLAEESSVSVISQSMQADLRVPTAYRQMCRPATDCKVGLNRVQAKPLFADDIWALVNTPPAARHHF